MNKSTFSTKLTDELINLLWEKKSPCVVKVNNVLCSLSAEEVITWLRKTYGLIITVDYYFDCTDTPHLVEDCLEWMISYPKKDVEHSSGHGYADSYEYAMMDAIKHALEII